MTEISLARIKAAAMMMPEPVKSLILSEPDTLDASELITKLGTWDRLLKIEKAENTKNRRK
ncbi:TVG0706547 [Thermoplasma volcanium GSS1]|uniref:TVG0706547 protein n=1 Tax=Thermoplasma volcanium (strain ATCC 51530 / DSM 4299 / JCM 9571 / NBRC 15438 / GSS1) TaxID=273116 RepID=Q97AV9_THEVO|nr:hypothetical protein [Thermoplasma volcanium]BAB59842.1 TVG0706547 [Thermoplasma volcanium GSS1]